MSTQVRVLRQTQAHSWQKFWHFCCQKKFCALQGHYVQTFVRSKLPMSRLLCVQRYLCPDYRAFIHVSRPVILNARHPLVRSFWSRHIGFRSGSSAQKNISTKKLVMKDNSNGSVCFKLKVQLKMQSKMHRSA